MEFKINSAIEDSMFGVPCIVADIVLKLATAEQVKVLLYILRNLGKNFTYEEISANTGIPEDEVEESVFFWEQINVIFPENSPNHSTAYTNIMTAPVQPSPEPAPPQKTAENPVFTEPSPSSKRPSHSPNEIQGLAKADSDIAQLMQSVRNISINASNTFHNSLIWIHDYLGLKNEVILILINYCMTIEKTHPNYMETIARNWAENEIDTAEKAQAEAFRLMESRTYKNKIMAMFDMKRRPTPNQQAFIDRWQEAGYSFDMIQYAYELTIEQIDKRSFPYINKILETWTENGVKTLDEAKNAVSDHRKSYKPKNSDNSDGFDADKYDIVVNNF
ncbi:MAG: DnaD domain protein [Ruminococcus flavefaciens]|nr:DnaD domain protein [Ruminococcus flavefaciens]MCM1229901.1 DnaD domain protein [Ruminococcus flavefaciens]